MEGDVRQWLQERGFGKYADAFIEHDVDFDILADLTDADLEKLGVTALGQRKRLLRAIAVIDGGGAAVPSAVPVPAPSAEAPSQAERRHLTVMFVDMVGSTALAARLDPEEMRTVLGRYQDTVAGVIARAGGHVAKFMGDGVLAYFGWPRVREDEAEIALRTGLGVLEAVARISVPGGDRLAARIGCSSGWVVIGDLVGSGEARERTVVGEPPNVAARLQTSAEPGQMLVSAATARLVGSRFDIAPLPPLDLKGYDQKIEAVRVLRERAAASRFGTRAGGARHSPLIGRDAEISLLCERWERAGGGEGQGVLLIGEAGIGKSRIAREVLERLRRTDHTRVRFQCSPYHAATPLWPVSQQIQRAAGLNGMGGVVGGVQPAATAAGEGPVADRLRALLELGLDDPEPTLPAFADLLGMEVPGSDAYQALSAAEKRSRMHDAMIEQLVGLSRKRPTLVVLEDAHWADPSTLEFLDLLLGAVANERVLVLITSRPEDLPELARPNMTQLALTRLGKAEVVNLIEAVMATDIALPEIVNEIASRTDGIPLFIEEVTKAVMEGRSEAADRKAAPIPASLHDSLMARLDRLEGVREVAQVAASIGREFDRGLLLDASGLDPRQVDDALDRLVEAELIFRRRGAQGAAFIFKHALVRDAAYSSLLGSRRRAIHAAILSALETRAGVAPALIGQHAQEAGDAARAIEAFTRAGGEAARQSANEEAVRAYERALALTAELPETEAESIRTRLQVAICVPLIAVCGYAAPEVEELHQETLRRLEADGSESDRFKVMRGLWNCTFDKGDLVRGGRLADTLVELAESSGRGDWLRLAYRAHGSNLFNEGRFAEARSAVEASINASAAWSRETTLFEHGEDPETISRQYLAVIRTIEGSLDMGLKLIDQALASARQLSLPISEVFARTHRDYVFYLLREPEACRENAESSLAISEDRHYPFWAASSRLFIGWAAALTTRDPAAMDEIKAGIAAWYTTGARLHMTTWNCVAADAALHLGRFSDAEAFLRDAFAFVDETGERFMLAELLRLRAWVLSANGRSDLAEVALRESLAVASQQGARLFGLRTAADLVRLQDRAGQGADGRERLTGMLRSFTEGFDRRDLQQAQALLAAS